MKANKFFAVALAALALVACKKNETIEVESVTLDQTSVTLAEMGATVQLKATVTPAGAATVEWTSSNPAVASVVPGNDGGLSALVTAQAAEGQAMIIAKAGGKQASCLVVVGEIDDDTKKFRYLLNGSDYYLFALDATSYEKIQNKVKGDFRINGSYEGEEIPAETTCVLEIWNSDLTDANWPTTEGLNCFGESEGWIAMNAANCSWGNMCGGLRQVHRTVDLSKVTNDHKLVILYKTPANNTSAAKVTFTLYSLVGATKIEKDVNARTNGEWTLLEYNMGDLFAAGLNWSEPVEIPGLDPAFYTLGITVTGAGQGVEVDAVFVYLPE